MRDFVTLVILFKPTNATRGERYHFDGPLSLFPFAFAYFFFIFTHIVHLVVQLRNMAKSERAVYIDGTERD